MIEVELTKPQAEFLTSDDFATLFSAGIGSGKSFIGSHWAKEKAFHEPEAYGLIAANTYTQLRNATLHTFFGVLEQHSINYKYNQMRNIITIGQTKVYAYSLDNYENLRGIEVGWIWLDETRDTERAAFDVALGRLRHRKAKRRQIRLTSSPSGFNWLYDYFAGPNKKPGYRIIQGSSFDNPFLPTGYIDSLKESYDQKMYEQEVLGQFVNTGVGQIYYAFSRPKNVKPQTHNPGFPLLVGMDFNINPMTAVIFQAYGDTVHVLDEVWLMSSNTHEMGEALRHRYGHAYMRVIPDSTGKARKTSSKGLSDHQILKDLGFDVIYANNPARFDRYVCVNNLAEKGRLEIDPKCTHLIDDLEKLTYKDGSTEPDTSDSDRGHIADALGYGCWHAYPLIKHQGGVSMVNR
jgi:phage terminase large subunit